MAGEIFVVDFVREFLKPTDLCLQIFRQALQHQLIRMVYHIAKLAAAQAAIGRYGVPVVFIHMVTGLNLGIAFAQLNGPFRVALYIKAVILGNVGEQEKFFAHFKNQRVLAKGQALGYARLCQAIIAYLFNIQAIRSA